MKQQTDFFKAAGIVVLCIFRSTPQNVARVAFGDKSSQDNNTKDDEDKAAGHALSDRNGSVYKSYQVKAKGSILKGTISIAKNMNSKYKQYTNIGAIIKETTQGGSRGINAMKQLPADFLIDENGIIVDVFRATTSSEHMPFERLEAFVPEGKRCQCNKKDCISSNCRRRYEEIRKENEALFGANHMYGV